MYKAYMFNYYLQHAILLYLDNCCAYNFISSQKWKCFNFKDSHNYVIWKLLDYREYDL